MEEKSISMEIINPHAAGIDVGSRSHWAATSQLEEDIREFGVFNEDLFALADWFKEKKVSHGEHWHILAKPVCSAYFKRIRGYPL